MEPTSACKLLRVSYAINIVRLLHVSTSALAILREVHYQGQVTKIFEPMRKHITLSFKMYGLFWRAKLWALLQNLHKNTTSEKNIFGTKKSK